MYGGGNPLHNGLWEIPCNAQHKNEKKNKNKKYKINCRAWGNEVYDFRK